MNEVQSEIQKRKDKKDKDKDKDNKQLFATWTKEQEELLAEWSEKGSASMGSACGRLAALGIPAAWYRHVDVPCRLGLAGGRVGEACEWSLPGVILQFESKMSTFTKVTFPNGPQ